MILLFATYHTKMFPIKGKHLSTLIDVFPGRHDPCPLHRPADGDPWEDQAAALPPAPGQAPGLWVGGAEAGGWR